MATTEEALERDPDYFEPLRFDVEGVPRPQGSLKHVGNGRIIPSSQLLMPWRAAVAWEANAAAMRFGQRRFLDGSALRVVAHFYFKRPASHYFKGSRSHVLREDAPVVKTTAPDVDKLMRTVLDALKQGQVIGDDKQVVSLTAEKRWGDPPRVEIQVRRVSWLGC